MTQVLPPINEASSRLVTDQLIPFKAQLLFDKKRRFITFANEQKSDWYSELTKSFVPILRLHTWDVSRCGSTLFSLSAD